MSCDRSVLQWSPHAQVFDGALIQSTDVSEGNGEGAHDVEMEDFLNYTRGIAEESRYKWTQVCVRVFVCE